VESLQHYRLHRSVESETHRHSVFRDSTHLVFLGILPRLYRQPPRVPSGQAIYINGERYVTGIDDVAIIQPR